MSKAKRSVNKKYRSKVHKETYPHFRHYKKSGHPAMILEEIDSSTYRFRRVTSSEFSGHHRNEKVDPNPDKRRSTPMYIVKQRQKDLKKNFSEWKYPWVYPKNKKSK